MVKAFKGQPKSDMTTVPRPRRDDKAGATEFTRSNHPLLIQTFADEIHGGASYEKQ